MLLAILLLVHSMEETVHSITTSLASTFILTYPLLSFPSLNPRLNRPPATQSSVIDLSADLEAMYLNVTTVVRNYTLSEGLYDNINVVRTASISPEANLIYLTFYELLFPHSCSFPNNLTL